MVIGIVSLSENISLLGGIKSPLAVVLTVFLICKSDSLSFFTASLISEPVLLDSFSLLSRFNLSVDSINFLLQYLQG